MELLDGILTRRSIRRYTDAIIPQDKVEKLVSYGMYAPSAHNRQPWQFVLLNNKTDFERVMEIHPHAKMLADAQWAIAVCGDEQQSLTPDYWPVDCSAATQNILLAAHGMGYGAVWLGIYPRSERMDAMSKLLALPANIHVFSLISLGYPAQQPLQPDRFDPAHIHLNRW